jgi:DNA-binding transcriptional LysR family regulator
VRPRFGTEHTTVARHIHALEEELNSRLFHRSNSGYGLTEVGERLLAGADAIESAYASAAEVDRDRSLFTAPTTLPRRHP